MNFNRFTEVVKFFSQEDLKCGDLVFWNWVNCMETVHKTLTTYFKTLFPMHLFIVTDDEFDTPSANIHDEAFFKS